MVVRELQTERRAKVSYVERHQEELEMAHEESRSLKAQLELQSEIATQSKDDSGLRAELKRQRASLALSEATRHDALQQNLSLREELATAQELLQATKANEANDKAKEKERMARVCRAAGVASDRRSALRRLGRMLSRPSPLEVPRALHRWQAQAQAVPLPAPVPEGELREVTEERDRYVQRYLELEAELRNANRQLRAQREDATVKAEQIDKLRGLVDQQVRQMEALAIKACR